MQASVMGDAPGGSEPVEAIGRVFLDFRFEVTTVSLLDTYPTLIELCGLPAKTKNEGLSLAAVPRNPVSATDCTVIQSDYKSFSLIHQNWRFTRYFNGEEELYNVAKDSGEHENLSAIPTIGNASTNFPNSCRKRTPKKARARVPATCVRG